MDLQVAFALAIAFDLVIGDPLSDNFLLGAGAVVVVAAVVGGLYVGIGALRS